MHVVHSCTGTDRCTACTQVRACTVQYMYGLRYLDSSQRTRLHQFVRGRKAAAKVHFRFTNFPTPPKLPASSSCHHPCQQLHKAPSPVSVGTCAQHYVGGDCERSRCRQPAGLGSAARACAVQRTLEEPQEAWSHSALAIACRVPLKGGCWHLRAACRRHHHGSSGEMSAMVRKCGCDRQRRLQRRRGRWPRTGC